MTCFVAPSVFSIYIYAEAEKCLAVVNIKVYFPDACNAQGLARLIPDACNAQELTRLIFPDG